MNRLVRVYSLLACTMLVAATTSIAAPRQAASTDRGQLLQDFLFYVLTANPELAAGNGQTLLDSGITDSELALLVDDNRLGDRVEEALRRGRSMAGVEDLIAQFESHLEKGRQELSRDRKRIDEAISMLTGNLRGQLQAKARLEAAGEYAVPALLNVIVNGRGADLELAATDMIVQIKRQSVTPLCAALPWLDANSQRKVCDMLGEIGWRHASPYLLRLAQDSNASQVVREGAMRAFSRVGGVEADASSAFTWLSSEYFREELSLIPWPSEAVNNIWSYDPAIGLNATSVPTSIYCEIMAMNSARESLTLSPDRADALSLFVAANLKRENELPNGESDPIFGEARYSPQFYATAAGTATCQNVLGLALQIKNTILVRDAIAALSQTTGGGNLFQGSDSGKPLLSCLRYPDRRVQYESALVLGRALPMQTFSGSEAVVPLLASAVRNGASSFAVVIADDAENRRLESSRLEGLGFNIVGSGANASEALATAADSVGIDLVVIRTTQDMVKAAIDSVQSSEISAVAPTLVVVGDPVEKLKLQGDYSNDPRLLIWQSAGDEAFAAAIEAVMTSGAGGRIGESEATQYAFDALDTLQMIAVANNPVYSIGDAETSLLEAMKTQTGGVRLVVADVVSRINTARSQQAIFDAALSASDREQIELLDHTAASARRFGNKAEQRQADALLKIVKESSGDLADAAARLHGALNLPASNAVQLIIQN